MPATSPSSSGETSPSRTRAATTKLVASSATYRGSETGFSNSCVLETPSVAAASSAAVVAVLRICRRYQAPTATQAKRAQAAVTR